MKELYATDRLLAVAACFWVAGTPAEQLSEPNSGYLPGNLAAPAMTIPAGKASQIPYLDSDLSELYLLWTKSENAAYRFAQNRQLYVSAGSVLVTLNMQDAQSATAAERWLADQGAKVETRFGANIDAMVPINKLMNAGILQGLRLIRRPEPVMQFRGRR